jgi:hypothetical protein
MNRERWCPKCFVALTLVATLNAGSVAAESMTQNQVAERQDGMDTIDACTEPSPTWCFPPEPDCQDLCGFCPGPPVCGYGIDGETPTWICCPRGMTAGWDDSRGGYVCVGFEEPCPDVNP